jgi:hypothetical protein
VVILNTLFIQDKSPCNGLSFCMLVSSTVTEIKILLIDQILDHFVHHPVFRYQVYLAVSFSHLLDVVFVMVNERCLLEVMTGATIVYRLCCSYVVTGPSLMGVVFTVGERHLHSPTFNSVQNFECHMLLQTVTCTLYYI